MRVTLVNSFRSNAISLATGAVPLQSYCVALLCEKDRGKGFVEKRNEATKVVNVAPEVVQSSANCPEWGETCLFTKSVEEE